MDMLEYATAPRDVRMRFDGLKARYHERDGRMYQMMMARKNKVGQIFRELFPEKWPKPIIANIMDVAARDVSEMLSPLPAVNCSSGSMATEKARAFADKKTQIVYSYTAASRLASQMYSGTDRFATYGFMPILVEPDYDKQTPKLRIDDPFGAYPEFDRWGQLVGYGRRYEKTVGELCSLYPEHAVHIRTRGTLAGGHRDDNAKLEMVQWIDEDSSMLYLPECKGHLLSNIPNKLDRIPVVCPVRPGLDGNDMFGEFDQILWVWVARARFALLSLEGATKAVEAPLAVPESTPDIPIGPDALIRSSDPSSIRRVSLDLPNNTFATEGILDREARIGARYPESRSGNMDASVITGQGVKELNGGFDSRIRAYQTILAEALTEAFSLALEMDEKCWGNKEKNVRGTRNGSPYEIKYRPSKDIAGDYTVDVQYGLMAGLDPNRALVFGLQARGEDLISRDFLRRQMPWELDVTAEEQRIDVEKLRDYLMQGIAGTVQAMPLLAQQGMNPLDLVGQVTEMIEARVKGKSLEDAAAKAFEPKEQPPAPAPGEPPLPGPGGQAGAGGPTGGVGADGLMPGVAPGQAGLPPGGLPDIQTLLAGLSSSGKPNLSANVQRRTAV